MELVVDTSHSLDIGPGKLQASWPTVDQLNTVTTGILAKADSVKKS